MGRNEETDRSKRSGYLILAPWEVTAHGGVNGVIRNLTREMLHCERLNPLIVESYWRYKSPRWRTMEGIPIAALRLRSPLAERSQKFGLRNLVAYVLTLPVAAWRITRILREYRVTVINIHYPTLTALTFIILKRLALFSGTIICSLHGSDARWGLSLKGLRGRAWIYILHRSEKIVTVSQQLAELMVKEHPELSSKISVIHNGVNLEMFRNIARSEILENDNVVIISIASFDLVKGLDVLLYAFASVKNMRSNVRLLIVGESGQDDDFIHQLSERLDLEPFIDWNCDVAHKDIPELLALADIFVLPSRNEGFGLVLLEAGAVGLPVIATRVGGTPELINDGNNGLLVESEDSQAISRAILWALDNRGEAIEMGQKLYQTVCNNFTWKSVYRKYEMLVVREVADYFKV